MSELRAEARAFGRYLLGVEPADGPVERYAAACGALFAGEPEPRDASLVAFARAHPWSLGPLDAALSLARRDALLRRKLVVLLACLEASPDHVAQLDDRTPGPLGAALGLAGLGARAAAKLAVGLVLVALVGRRGR